MRRFYSNGDFCHTATPDCRAGEFLALHDRDMTDESDVILSAGPDAGLHTCARILIVEDCPDIAYCWTIAFPIPMGYTC